MTDNDGQYIEAQSGAILNQAAERSGFHSPFTQLSLRPLYAETKREYWFPVKNTGGMSDATPSGTLNVIARGDSLKIVVSANEAIADSLTVVYNNQTVYSTYVQLQPMKVTEKTIALRGMDPKAIRVSLGKEKLLFAEKENVINRPVVASAKDTSLQLCPTIFQTGRRRKFHEKL